MTRRAARPLCWHCSVCIYSAITYLVCISTEETRMSVRQSLLAILDQGPCYGYKLRTAFERRPASTWPPNVGQSYNTIDRLERDGLVEKGEPDEHGHIYFEITDAGRAEVRTWLSSPVQRSSGTRDELAIKVA